jgi:hypothetical protein
MNKQKTFTDFEYANIVAAVRARQRITFAVHRYNKI